MSNECVAVFTAHSSRRILHDGGSQAWALDPNRTRKCSYLVCVQNQNKPDRDFSDTSAAHGAIFMVGKISDVIPATEDSRGRWKICISEFAMLTVVNAWKGWRNPVRYTTLEEMGINLNDLAFQSVAIGQRDFGIAIDQQAPKKQDDGSVIPLSISSAKAGLAAYYGVSQEAIEIVIRG